MTPSGWHDNASGRDAGHDEMQAGVYRFMRSQPRKMLHKPDKDSVLMYDRVGVYFECPFYGHNQQISTFVDVCVLYRKSPEIKGYVPHKEIIFCYEIKPRIYSVGAVVRQCHATENAVIGGSLYRTDWNRQHGDTPEVNVIPVVPNDDPKLALLAEFSSHVMVWDPVTLTCASYPG